MKTSNKITNIKSIDFRFLDQYNFANIPQNIKDLVNHLPNIDSAEGFLLGQKENGSNLTIVPYFLEFFPYENKISFHISFLSEKASYLSTLSILYSYILLCNKMHVNNLISRHSINELDTLLMSLDLGFNVKEFSRNSIPHIVVEKNFTLKKNIIKEEKYISAFKENYPIKKMNVKGGQMPSDTLKKSGEPQIYDSISNLQAFSRWLNIDYDQFPKTFLELDQLCKKQSNFKGTIIGSGEKTYYFIENNNTIGALLCPETFKVRRVLKSVWKVLNDSNSEVVYTNKHDDWIDSILFLAGFVMVSSENKQDDSLWKWERI